jgi:hypothetical protein
MHEVATNKCGLTSKLALIGDRKVPPLRCFAVAAGADSRSVLADAGFSSNEIIERIRDKVLFAPEEV